MGVDERNDIFAPGLSPGWLPRVGLYLDEVRGLAGGPLSRKLGTYKIVKAIFWAWLSCQRP
jgi:hypothetical protein